MSTFETSREIPASPGEVFAAFETTNRLASWWGPKGLRLDLHPQLQINLEAFE